MVSFFFLIILNTQIQSPPPPQKKKKKKKRQEKSFSICQKQKTFSGYSIHYTFGELYVGVEKTCSSTHIFVMFFFVCYCDVLGTVFKLREVTIRLTKLGNQWERVWSNSFFFSHSFAHVTKPKDQREETLAVLCKISPETLSV